MKVDATFNLSTFDLATTGERARRLEALGYDGLFAPEAKHDPFLPLVLAAEHSQRLELATAIALAFPRSPMHLAYIGHDLQAFSRGRFILGLGSQVKAHVEKRFSSAFSRPVERMRELIAAVRAIWDCWEDGTPLRFEGEFYRHTLMTPFFDPGPTGYGRPRIFLAAVGQKMTEVVGELADGMFVHAFTTEKYLQETTMPALERGLGRSGRSRSDLELSLPLFIVTGEDDQERERADVLVREQIAFYGSTPAYRTVLEAHGWGDLGDELNSLSKQGQWKEMGRRITDDVLDAFAISGKSDELPGRIIARWGGLIDRFVFYTPYLPDPDAWGDLARDVKVAARG